MIMTRMLDFVCVALQKNAFIFTSRTVIRGRVTAQRGGIHAYFSERACGKARVPFTRGGFCVASAMSFVCPRESGV